jgi:hypothetical protein
MHGGSAPQVKAKAAERIEEVRDNALRKLGEAVTGGMVDPKTLLDASVKLSELAETLEGRVARREEHRHSEYSELSDGELERAIVREAERIVGGAAKA